MAAAGADASATVTVTNPLGLHIRPSRKIAELVRTMNAEVTVRCLDRSAAGDSQLDLLMLLAGAGSELSISANGPDAEKAVEAVAALVREGFGET